MSYRQRYMPTMCAETLAGLSGVSAALRRRTALLTAAALCALSALFAVSCSHEADLPDPGTEEAGEVWLSVSLRDMESGRQMPESRAAGLPSDPDGHPDEEGLEAENYIDVDDMSIMLFDADGALVAVAGSEEFDVTRRSDGVYSLLVKTSADRFSFASGGSGSLTFTMMILANLHGTGDGDGAFPLTYLLSTPQTLSDTRRGFGYTGLAGTAPWTPSIADGRLIPMAGTVTATVTEAQLKAGDSPENAVQLPAMYMQRAMAQVRLIDAVADDNFEITDVRMRGGSSRGAYLPALSRTSPWRFNTEVLEYGTSAAGWFRPDVTLPSQPVTYVSTRGDSGVLKPGKAYDCFRLYVAEYDHSLAAGASVPTLDIDVLDKTSGKTLGFSYTFRSEEDGGYRDFVRNHIYEVVVTDVKTDTETTLKFTYGICPWETPDAVDIPSFDRPGDKTDD